MRQFETSGEVKSLSRLFGSARAKHEVVEKIGENFECFFPRNTELSTVAGIRLSLEDGWILIRASGTESVIRLTVEGESLRTAKKIMEKGVMLVKQSAGKVKR